jgi:DNA-binding MarR family transcriptional regulator
VDVQQSLRRAAMGEPIDEAVLAALSQPIRIALLVSLERDGEQTPEELAERLGIGEGDVHQHVTPLHELGLVADGDDPHHLKVDTEGWTRIAAQLRRLQRRPQ